MNSDIKKMISETNPRVLKRAAAIAEDLRSERYAVNRAFYMGLAYAQQMEEYAFSDDAGPSRDR